MIIHNVIISTQTSTKPMINLDERYHEYLHGTKKLRINGAKEIASIYISIKIPPGPIIILSPYLLLHLRSIL